MTLRRFKTNVFVLEGFNAFATGLYFNWLFFFTQNRLHFGVAENLGLVALHGLIYTGAAWCGGWFAHRFGNFHALKIGFFTMAAALGAGNFFPVAPAQIAVLLAWTIGMCFTWPVLQSLLGQGERDDRMPRMAGIYNVVWSGVSALSYFLGGAILKQFGLLSLFWIPALIHLGQLAHVFWLEKKSAPIASDAIAESTSATKASRTTMADPAVRKKFLVLALLANPAAYVAINTAIPMMPVVAKRFDLSLTMTGFFCSIWFFVRMGSFILFWHWPGWHYRFGVLLAAKFFLIASLIGILLAPSLWILLVAQIFFGVSLGLIYYSSLYYSIHGGNSKGRHGGLHEAMIGFGTFLGAAVGVGAKYFFPHVGGISIWAVGGLLLAGFFGLIWLRYKR